MKSLSPSLRVFHTALLSCASSNTVAFDCIANCCSVLATVAIDSYPDTHGVCMFCTKSMNITSGFISIEDSIISGRVYISSKIIRFAKSIISVCVSFSSFEYTLYILQHRFRKHIPLSTSRLKNNTFFPMLRKWLMYQYANLDFPTLEYAAIVYTFPGIIPEVYLSSSG